LDGASCNLYSLALCYVSLCCFFLFFFFQAEDGIRDRNVTGVQTVLFRSCLLHVRTTRTKSSCRRRRSTAAPVSSGPRRRTAGSAECRVCSPRGSATPTRRHGRPPR